MGNAEVKKLEILSMELDKEKIGELIELIDSVNASLNEFTKEGAYKGMYRDDKGPFFQVESYTRDNWQWWQIVASFMRMKEALSLARDLRDIEYNKKQEILGMEKRIEGVIKRMRGGL